MQEKYSTIIIDFLKSHPLISVRALEETLNIPQSTIGQSANGRLIPAKHIFPLVCHLAGYGLTIDGYDLNYDPADGVLSARKLFENMDVIEIEEETSSYFEYIVKEYRWVASDYFDLL